MDRFFQSLRPLIRGVVHRAGVIVTLALLFAALGVYFAQNLRVDTDFANLLPDDYPSVQALERLQETVGGETSMDVAISSPSFEANKAFAEALIPHALALQDEQLNEPFLTRAELQRDTEFLKDNALYFATPAELDSLENYLESQIEEAKLAANPFFFDLEEEEEEAPDSTGQLLLASYDQIVGREFFVSEDSTVLVLKLYPSGSKSDISYIERLYGAVDDLVAEMQPSSFQPEMEVTLAGRLYRQLLEVQTITDDVKKSFGAGVGAVLLFVVLYFFYKSVRARSGGVFNRRIALQELARVPLLALVVGLPLMMSLAWTFGMAYLIYGALNLMTSTLGLVLFGLGIDYGIHFYARYTEERGEGLSVVDAAEKTFVSTGQAITVGALTTAAALYVLVIADFKGFSEFGFIAGTGVLFALIAMLVVMPALLAVFERFKLLHFGAQGQAVAARGATGERFPAARGIVLGSLALVIASLVLLPRVDFEYQFGELEPSYPEWSARNNIVKEAIGEGNGRNPAYIVLDDPSEAPAVAAAVREKIADPTDTTRTVDRVESLQDRFPTTQEAQQQRLARIRDIRAQLDDEFIQASESEDLQKLRRASQTTVPISLEEVPDFLKQQFTSKTGEIGNFTIIYPDPDITLSDGRMSIAFAEDIGTITKAEGKEYHAGSTSLVAADMLSLMLREAPWMTMLTFVIVALLMWLNFGAIRWALLAMLPLLVGLLWMLLMMEVFGLKLNFYNLVVLPAVLGIGNDAGAHLVHRYREEGAGSIRAVLRSTGEHVTMGALTTMIGFAGLMLSFHPGLESIGMLAVVGIGTTLLAALLFLPALLQWLEDRQTPETAAAAFAADEKRTVADEA